jgi:hypothetical protein
VSAGVVSELAVSDDLFVLLSRDSTTAEESPGVVTADAVAIALLSEVAAGTVGVSIRESETSCGGSVGWLQESVMRRQIEHIAYFITALRFRHLMRPDFEASEGTDQLAATTKLGYLTVGLHSESQVKKQGRQSQRFRDPVFIR